MTKRPSISAKVLRRLPLDEGLAPRAISRRGGLSEIAVRSRPASRFAIRARPFNTPAHPHADFSGDPVEQAYRLGLRQGDPGVFQEERTVAG